MRSARERVTGGALLDAPSPEGEAARPGSGFTLRRSRAAPTASQRSGRARPARASPAQRHDELGHPHPPSRTTRWLPWQGFLTRVGAGGAVTPVTFRPTSATHDFVYKERVPRLPRTTPRRIPRGTGALGFTTETLASAGRRVDTERFFPARLVRRTSDASSPISSPSARCASVLGARAPDRTQCPSVSARRSREVTSGRDPLAQAAFTSPRERQGFHEPEAPFPSPLVHPETIVSSRAPGSRWRTTGSGELGGFCSVIRPSGHDPACFGPRVVPSTPKRFGFDPGVRAPSSPTRPRSGGRPVTPELPIGLSRRRPSVKRLSRAVLEPEPERDPFEPLRHPSSSSRDLPRLGPPPGSTKRPRSSLAPEGAPSDRVPSTTSRFEPELSARLPPRADERHPSSETPL
jgi:hypothetical protein